MAATNAIPDSISLVKGSEYLKMMILLQLLSASGIGLFFVNNLLIGLGNEEQCVRVSILKVVCRFTPTALINFLLLNGFLASNPNHCLLSKFSTYVAQEAQVVVNHRGWFSPTAGFNL